MRKGLAAEEDLGAHMLAERLAFAAFPWLEAACGEESLRFCRLTGLVVKRAEFDAEVVAAGNEREVFFEGAQTFGGGFAEAFAELVAFVEEAGVGGGEAAGAFVGGAGLGGLFMDVKVTDAEVAPDDGE